MGREGCEKPVRKQPDFADRAPLLREEPTQLEAGMEAETEGGLRPVRTPMRLGTRVQDAV